MTIICALDTHSIDDIHRLLDLREDVYAFKVGLELYSWFGFPILRTLTSNGVSIFLDLKFHDIPNTVHQAVKRFNKSQGIKMLTVHAAGGEEMIKAAVDATDIDIIAVTLLTSIKDEHSDRLVVKYTEEALNAGAAGVVCSANEVKLLRDIFGNDFKIVVPGIRPSWYSTDDDQVRTGTPKQVIENGGDFLVIGRPISSATSPLDALQKIKKELL